MEMIGMPLHARIEASAPLIPPETKNIRMGGAVQGIMTKEALDIALHPLPIPLLGVEHRTEQLK